MKNILTLSIIVLTAISGTAHGIGGSVLPELLLSESIAHVYIEDFTFSSLREELLTKDAEVSIGNSKKRMNLINFDKKTMLLQDKKENNLILIQTVETRDESNINEITIENDKVTLEIDSSVTE